ncbi:MAG TPA: zinc ribbon domain-containing protein [Solirubrobacterales bacterium]|nr:zinc ribbon domain-containing protein [Solirubrobacterales bacterium]
MGRPGERVSWFAAAISLATFVVSFISTSAVLAALGIVGLVSLAVATAWIAVAAAVVAVFGVPDAHEKALRIMALGILVALAGIGAALWFSGLLSLGDGLDRFGIFQAAGIVTLVWSAGFIAIESRRAFRDRHKSCPECANTVLDAARVCHFCGFRWEPELEFESQRERSRAEFSDDRYRLH